MRASLKYERKPQRPQQSQGKSSKLRLWACDLVKFEATTRQIVSPANHVHRIKHTKVCHERKHRRVDHIETHRISIDARSPGQVTACTACNPRLVLNADKTASLSCFQRVKEEARSSSEYYNCTRCEDGVRSTLLIHRKGFELTDWFLTSNWGTCKGQTRTVATLPERGLFLSLVLDSWLPHFIFHPLLELPSVDVRSMPLWRAEIRDCRMLTHHSHRRHIVQLLFFFFFKSILSWLPFCLCTFTSLDTGSQNLHNLRSALRVST